MDNTIIINNVGQILVFVSITLILDTLSKSSQFRQTRVRVLNKKHTTIAVSSYILSVSFKLVCVIETNLN